MVNHTLKLTSAIVVALGLSAFGATPTTATEPGITSTAVELTGRVDIPNGGWVAVTSPINGEVVATAQPTFTGTGQPGRDVTISNGPSGGEIYATATVDEQGNWTARSEKVLPRGPQTLYAIQLVHTPTGWRISRDSFDFVVR